VPQIYITLKAINYFLKIITKNKDYENVIYKYANLYNKTKYGNKNKNTKVLIKKYL